MASERKVIQGEDIIIVIDGKPTLHATTHSLKVDLELKELRTKNTNGKEKCAGDISWSADGDGLVVIDPEITEPPTAEEVLDLVLSKTEVEVMLKAPLQGLTKNYKGKGFVTSFSLSTPAGDNSTYNYSITGSGDLAAATKA
mgnify:CR=1 FL=1